MRRKRPSALAATGQRLGLLARRLQERRNARKFLARDFTRVLMPHASLLFNPEGLPHHPRFILNRFLAIGEKFLEKGWAGLLSRCGRRLLFEMLQCLLHIFCRCLKAHHERTDIDQVMRLVAQVAYKTLRRFGRSIGANDLFRIFVCHVFQGSPVCLFACVCHPFYLK